MAVNLADLPNDGFGNVLDAGHMLSVFLLLLGEGSKRNLASVHIRVLRYDPGDKHGVIEYGLASTDASEFVEYVGKVFNSRSRAERLYRVLEALRQHFGALTPAPVPLGFLEEGSMVLMSKLSGDPLVDILGRGNENTAIEATGLAAKALAALHSVLVPDGKSESLDHELASLRKDNSEICQYDASVAREAERILSGIEDLALRLPHSAQVMLTHGSFRASEVLVTPERASILDLDKWAMGDPARDIGYYLADLWEESNRKEYESLRRYGETFLDQYVRATSFAGVRDRAHVRGAHSCAVVVEEATRHRPRA